MHAAQTASFLSFWVERDSWFVPFPSSYFQAELMSSMLASNNSSAPGPLPISSPMAAQTSRTSGGRDDAIFVQNYMPLFSGHVVPRDQAAVSSVSRPLSHDPLAQCLPGQDMASAAPMVALPLDNIPALDETVEPSAITHETSSTVKPSDAGTNFSHASDYSSISPQPPPPPSQLQPLAPLTASSVQHPQTFALPRPPFQASSANKSRPVKRIAPANTLSSSHLILTGLFLLVPRSRSLFCNFSFHIVDL